MCKVREVRIHEVVRPIALRRTPGQLGDADGRWKALRVAEIAGGLVGRRTTSTTWLRRVYVTVTIGARQGFVRFVRFGESAVAIRRRRAPKPGGEGLKVRSDRVFLCDLSLISKRMHSCSGALSLWHFCIIGAPGSLKGIIVLTQPYHPNRFFYNKETSDKMKK